MEEVNSKLSVIDKTLPTESMAVPKQSVSSACVSQAHHIKKSLAANLGSHHHSQRHTVTSGHPGFGTSTFFHDGAPRRSLPVLPHHACLTHSRDEREKIFLIPREVKITFGPYFHLGILDYRTEWLSGLQSKSRSFPRSCLLCFLWPCDLICPNSCVAWQDHWRNAVQW